VALNRFLSFQPDSRVILYGCGRVGKYVLKELEDQNIKVAFGIDRNNHISTFGDNIPIILPEQYKPQAEDIIICCFTFHNIYLDVKRQLEKLKIGNVLYYEDCFTKEDRKCLFTHEHVSARDCRNCIVREVECRNSIVDLHNGARRKTENSSSCLPYIERLTIQTTTKCVLNCRDCGSCVPAYKETGKSFELVLDDFKECWNTLRKSVAFIKTLVISGGEALIYCDIQGLLKFLCDDPKIGVIQIITTGLTAISDTLGKLLQHDKIVVTLDNYGDKIPVVLQKKYAASKERLQKLDVNITEIDNSIGTWYQFGLPEEKGRTEAENKQVFSTCGQSECLIISEDLYLEKCGMPSRFRDLGYTGFDADDMLNLRGKSVEELQKELPEYLSKQVLTACGYCNGNGPDNIVLAGIQKV